MGQAMALYIYPTPTLVETGWNRWKAVFLRTNRELGATAPLLVVSKESCLRTLFSCTEPGPSPSNQTSRHKRKQKNQRDQSLRIRVSVNVPVLCKLKPHVQNRYTNPWRCLPIHEDEGAKPLLPPTLLAATASITAWPFVASNHFVCPTRPLSCLAASTACPI